MTEAEAIAIRRRVDELENENASICRQLKEQLRHLQCDGCYWERRRVPMGAERLSAYLYRGQVVIMGDPENEDHNCDAMGCSSVEHVIRRFEYPPPPPPPPPKETP